MHQFVASPPWGAIARFQDMLEDPPPSRPGQHYWDSCGREEAFAVIVGDLHDGRLDGDVAALTNRFENLCVNRAAKQRRRRNLDRARAPLVESVLASGNTDSPLDRLGVGELTAVVRSTVPARDWPLLWEVAEGRTGDEVAARNGLTLENLKSRLGRARERIRKSVVGRVIARALAA